MAASAARRKPVPTGSKQWTSPFHGKVSPSEPVYKTQPVEPTTHPRLILTVGLNQWLGPLIRSRPSNHQTVATALARYYWALDREKPLPLTAEQAALISRALRHYSLQPWKREAIEEELRLTAQEWQSEPLAQAARAIKEWDWWAFVALLECVELHNSRRWKRPESETERALEIGMATPEEAPA